MYIYKVKIKMITRKKLKQSKVKIKTIKSKKLK